MAPPDPQFLERAWSEVADAARAACITVILGTERVTNRGLQISVCVINPDGSIQGWLDKGQIISRESRTLPRGGKHVLPRVRERRQRERYPRSRGRTERSSVISRTDRKDCSSRISILRQRRACSPYAAAHPACSNCASTGPPVSTPSNAARSTRWWCCRSS